MIALAPGFLTLPSRRAGHGRHVNLESIFTGPKLVAHGSREGELDAGVRLVAGRKRGEAHLLAQPVVDGDTRPHFAQLHSSQIDDQGGPVRSLERREHRIRDAHQ